MSPSGNTTSPEGAKALAGGPPVPPPPEPEFAYPVASAGTLTRANGRKREFLSFFEANDGRFADGNQAKPYTGELSPGCKTCVQGTWSCLYLNGLCTRDCFYCPQDRRITQEPPARTDDQLTFTAARDYAAYATRFPVEGVAFSGGEPLLVFDRLLEHIRAVREALGAHVHVWCYTNGDRLTDDKLARLKAAGLDEIRINISANGYDLAAPRLAARYLDTVTVEIPVIPEDVERVQSALPHMQAAGIRHLNLHQLMINEFNASELVKRRYAATHIDRYEHGRPVLDSELAAFDIMEHAIKAGLQLGINYCSRCYKARFQERAYRKRHAFLFGIHPAAVTGAGYVRRMVLAAARQDLESCLPALSRAEPRILPGTGADGWGRVPVSEQDLAAPLLPDRPHRVEIEYEEPLLTPVAPGQRATEQVLHLPGNTVCLERKEIRKVSLENPVSEFFFHRLFVAKRDVRQVARDAAHAFALSPGQEAEIADDVQAFRGLFEGVEYSSTDLPDYD